MEGITITEEDLIRSRELRYIRKSFDHPSKQEQEEMNKKGLFTKKELKQYSSEKCVSLG